jgi:hypothetical protein
VVALGASALAADKNGSSELRSSVQLLAASTCGPISNAGSAACSSLLLRFFWDSVEDGSSVVCADGHEFRFSCEDDEESVLIEVDTGDFNVDDAA